MRRHLAIALVSLGASAFVSASDIPLAYRNIARTVGVPDTILYAIALQESRLQVGDAAVPWPWTLNVDGAPKRFHNRAEMAAAIRVAEARGARFIDVGAMQINLHFNGHRFRTRAEMIDPYVNIRVAAEILRDERETCGDWWCAVGRYHSRTPARAEHYREGVKRWFSLVGG